MKFKIVYLIFLFVCLLYPSLPLLGGLSIRHVLSLVMFVLCYQHGDVRLDKFLKWYIVFLVFFGFSSLITGFFVEFFRGLIGTYFSAAVLYWSTITMIKKYESGGLIISFLLVIAIINSVFVIGQFYHYPWAIIAPKVLQVNLGEEMVDLYEGITDFHGRYVGGLLDIVSAGYFLSAASILALYLKKGKVSLINWIVFVFILFALFLVQERSGLLLGIACSFVYFILLSSKSKSTIFTLLIALAIILYFSGRFANSLISIEDMRYSDLSYSRGRLPLIKQSWDYFTQNPMGAFYQWRIEGHEQAHNFIANALLTGGFFGGLVVIGIILKQLMIVVEVMFSFFRGKKSSLLLLVFSIVYLNYTLSSFFHNPSLIGGTPLFFVFWGAVRALLNREKFHIKDNII